MPPVANSMLLNEIVDNYLDLSLFGHFVERWS